MIVRMRDAKAAGLKRYFTGKPCGAGHVAERLVSNSICIECNREKYRAAFPPGSKARSERGRDYYERNRESENARSQAWRLENLDRSRSRVREWLASNPEKRTHHKRTRRALECGAEGQHTMEDVLDILESQNWFCMACPADLKDGYHVDHIVPLTRGGSNWPSNLQGLCPACNLSKGDRLMSEWSGRKLAA